MKHASILTAVLMSLGATTPALAGVINIDFETAPSFGSIGNLYAGLGVTFRPDALGLQNDALGPYFSNAPSPLGVMFAAGPDSAMNVAGGFIEISLFFSSSEAINDAVQVWSGLNGTGNLLASLSLANNAQAGGCTDSAYCNFSQTGTNKLGALAYSVTFASAANNVVAFDNVNLVPEPASTLLVALGLAGVAFVRRR